MQIHDNILRLWIFLCARSQEAHTGVALSVGPQPREYVEKYGFVASISKVLQQNWATNPSTSYLGSIASWRGLVFELCRPLYAYTLNSSMHTACSVWPCQTRNILFVFFNTLLYTLGGHELENRDVATAEIAAEAHFLICTSCFSHKVACFRFSSLPLTVWYPFWLLLLAVSRGHVLSHP